MQLQHQITYKVASGVCEQKEMQIKGEGEGEIMTDKRKTGYKRYVINMQERTIFTAMMTNTLIIYIFLIYFNSQKVKEKALINQRICDFVII